MLDGCIKSATASKNSNLSSTPNLSAKLVSTDSYMYDQYLCNDTAVYIFYSDYQSAYLNPQWYQVIDNDTVIIDGETNDTIMVDQPGEYLVKVESAICTGNYIYSNIKSFKHYSEYVPTLKFMEQYEDNCLGNDMTLVIDDNYNAEFSDFLWYMNDISMGSGGYEETYNLINEAIEEDTLVTTSYNKYFAKATYAKCPSVLLTTDTLQLMPSLTPNTLWDQGVVYDSNLTVIGLLLDVIFCENKMIKLMVDTTNLDMGAIKSFQWIVDIYKGSDDFVLGMGEEVEGATSYEIEVPAQADWYSCIITDTNGCQGISMPILLDSYAFLSPAISSYDNNELCSEGDSTLLHLAFPGEWDSFEWFLDGVAVADSDTDSIYAKEVGQWVLTAYPSLCPDAMYSSGVGPVVKFMPEAEIWENDTVIYAMPELGEYYYQWYFNDEPINMDTLDIPWILNKEDLQVGSYTVEVENGIPCVRMSEPYIVSENSSENDILTFELNEQTSAATIDADAHTVNISVASGTVLTALMPTITVSANATIDPASGVAQDFSSVVTYTVTAQDGTTQAWTVTVSLETGVSSAKIDKTVNIYPNPINNKLNINVNSPTDINLN